MSSPCRELETALKNNDGRIPEGILRHAEGCPACAAAVQSWTSISEAARAMKRSWESPELWPRIERSLVEASAQKASQAPHRLTTGKSLWASTLSWRLASAAALLLVLCLWGTWSLLSRFQPAGSESRRLLTEQALKEIETSEQAYAQSIDKLFHLVQPQAKPAESPLLASYREKLLFIDAAIAECRAGIEINRYNAHLRLELLAMYREKQNTLEELLKEESHARN